MVYWSADLVGVDVVSRALQRLSLVSYICAFGNAQSRRCIDTRIHRCRRTESTGGMTGRPLNGEKTKKENTKRRRIDATKQRVKHVAGRLRDTRVSPWCPTSPLATAVGSCISFKRWMRDADGLAHRDMEEQGALKRGGGDRLVGDDRRDTASQRSSAMRRAHQLGITARSSSPCSCLIPCYHLPRTTVQPCRPRLSSPPSPVHRTQCR